MAYNNNRGKIKEPKSPASDAQLNMIQELLDERDVDAPQELVIRCAIDNGLLKGRASGYIGLLINGYDVKPSAEVLELRAQLAEMQAAAAEAARNYIRSQSAES
jgi:hypothetical protein